MVTVGDDPLLGLVVEGRYRIESVIGQGSAGTVYKAIQELIGREVAIKVLHDYLVSDDEFIKRFRQEAKASSRLSHPNIITIYDFGVLPKTGRPYIAMDLLRGTPLSDVITEQNHLPLEEAIPIMTQVCSALGEAHRQGVVHRDVKPENIVLVDRSGQHHFPIVVDFGIARLVQEDADIAKITRTGTVCGSPTYMSPEQCTSSKVDHRSDIYSLGIVIYETLTGTVPFMSDELAKVMAMHLTDPPKPLNQVRLDLRFPDRLEEVVNKALAKNPDERYQSMEEFSDALAEAAKSQDKPHPSLSVSQPLPVIEPGPLAKSEDFGGQKHSSDKNSREFIHPKHSTKDLATRALEELAQRTSGQYEEIEAAAKAASIAQQKKSSPHYQKSRKGPGLIGRLMQVGFPVLIGICIAVGAVMFATGAFTSRPSLKKATVADAEALVREGKAEQAIPIIEVLKQAKLSGKDRERINSLYIQLAKQYANKKDYDEAISWLGKVSSKSAHYKQAKDLLRQYKRKT
ncbi:MAG TPA: serine/threonine-protein kinase [Candidatus Obscuribacterales bacterium]